MALKLKRIISILLVLLCVLNLFSCQDNTKEEEKMIKKIYEETEDTPVLLGVWVPPLYRLTETDEDADMRYKELKEVGVNMTYTHHPVHEVYNVNQLLRSLDAAHKHDIKVIVILRPGQLGISMVEKTKDHPAVMGYNLVDEPGFGSFSQLANLRDKLKEMVDEDKIIMCNLFPNYAPDSFLGTSPTEDKSSYEVYVERYMDMIRPDVLSFDHYPFLADKTQDNHKIQLMLQNFSIIRLYGERYNVDTWGFVQNSSWQGTRLPNDDELRFVVHFHLIFGLKSFSYFLYCQPDEKPGVEGVFEGMITYNGEKTDVYYRVQKQNQDINAMKGVFMKYDHKVFMTHNMPEEYVASIDQSLRVENYEGIDKIESDGKLLIGCFERDGKTGFYVMNFDYEKGTKATIRLDDKYEFKVWGANGLEQLKNGNKVEIELLPGEGRFIEIN